MLPLKNKQTVSVLLLAFPGLLRAADFAFVQTGSPLQIVGATSDLDIGDFYSRVMVVNVSQKAVLRARFGWTMADDDAKRTVATGYGPAVDLNLSPFEVAQVGAQGATLSIVSEKSKGIQHVKLKLGVVYVKFKDGTEWEYSIEQHTGFEEIEDPALVQKITPKVQEFREKNGLVGAVEVPGSCPTGPVSPYQTQRCIGVACECVHSTDRPRTTPSPPGFSCVTRPHGAV